MVEQCTLEAVLSLFCVQVLCQDAILELVNPKEICDKAFER